MGYELKKLSAQHRRIVSLVLEGRWGNKQIAQIMGYTPEAIGQIVACGAFQEEVARRRSQIERIENENIGNNLALTRELLEREALPSVMKLSEIRDTSPDQNLQRQSANDLLKHVFGRDGGPAAPQIGQIVVLAAEQMAFMNQVAKEAGVDVGSAGSTEPAVAQPDGSCSASEAS